MAAAPPAANAAPSSPARPFPSSSSSTAAGATTKAWVVTTAAPSAGPREAVLLRRLRGVDPEIEAVEVQEFYFMRTREGAQEDGGLAEGVMGVLREASAAGAPGPAPPAAVGASTTEMGRESHHCHYHWRAYAPRPAFRSVWGSNVRSILAARGLLADEGDPRLPTLEAGRWYRVRKASGAPLGEEAEALLHDRMTECAFLPLLPNTADGASPPAAAWGAVGATALPTPLPAAMLLDTEAKTGTVTLPLRARGPVVLEEASAQYGLGLGPWEVGFLTELFWDPAHGIERDPTAMEIFDVAQSLSEHCRHWTFDGRFVVDGAERRESLMEMVKAPLRRLQQQQQEQDGDGAGGGDDDNSVLAFEDNSSAIRGPTRVLDFQPARPDGPSPYVRVEVRAVA